MKRMISLILAMLLLLAGCGSAQTPAAPAVEGNPSEIIEKIYKEHKSIDLSLVTQEMDLTDEGSVSVNLGLDSADRIQEAALSETMMGQPYSLVICRVKDAKDAPALAKELYEKIDTRKWICVMADDKTAAYCGDVVMFFMVNSDFADVVTAASIAEAFNAVCGGKATIL